VKFSYKHYNEHTAPILQRDFALRLEAFREWCQKTEFRAQRALDDNFGAWWLMRGPINFETTEDQRRYKAELWDYIRENWNG
jgi:hypothetical protein